MNDVQGLGVSVKAWATAGLVPGVRLRVPAGELATHLKARAEHHRRRAADKSAELPRLREAMEAIKPHKAVAQTAMTKSVAQTAQDILMSGMGYVWYHSPADGLNARRLDEALSTARSARFEHGETPEVYR